MPPHISIRRAIRPLAILLFCASAQADSITIAIHPPDGAPAHIFTVELAATAEERRRGLSHRQHLPQTGGMLFHFTPARERVCMWMKDTHFPLVALFADPNGAIFQKSSMQPRTTTPHCAAPGTPVQHVLELPPAAATQLPIGAILRRSNN